MDVSDDTPWLSADELETWKYAAGVVVTLPTAIDAQLKKDAGLNFYEYSILVLLQRSATSALQLWELAQWAHGSQSRLSHAITRMETQGWVIRRDVKGETRGVEAVLTDAGRAKLVEAAPAHVREVRRLVVDVLTPEQLAHFGEICRALLSVVSPGAPVLLESPAQVSTD